MAVAAIAFGLGDGVGDGAGVGRVAAVGGKTTARQGGDLVEAEFDCVHGLIPVIFGHCYGRLDDRLSAAISATLPGRRGGWQCKAPQGTRARLTGATWRLTFPLL